MSAIPRPFTILGPGNGTTAAAVIGDNQLVRGDGGARGVQGSVWTLDDTGTLTGAGSQTIAMLSTGAIAFAAAGTNQNITLTPSGTGNTRVIASGATGTTYGVLGVTYAFAKTDTTERNVAAWTSNETAGSTWKLLLTATGNAAAASRLFSFQTSNEGVANNGILALQASGGSVLLGTTTDSSNGRLQLAAHTTSAGGIGFGTDTALFRNTAGRLSVAHTTRPQFDLEMGGTIGASWFHTSGGVFMDAGTGYGLAFRTNGTTTALTLDTSQNVTGVGYLNGSKVLVSAKTQAVSPYSVSSTTDNRVCFTNEGATGGVTFSLPTAAANLDYTFYVQAAQTLTIDAASGDTIRFGATVTAADGSISSSTVGSAIRLRAINATEWVAVALVGTWA